MIKNFDQLLEVAKKQERMKLAVAAAQDEEVLMAVTDAWKEGLVEPILVGNEEEINKIAKEHNIDISGLALINNNDLTESARIAVKLVSDGKADFLMKGILDTSIILKAALDKEIGLRTGNHLSHVMLCEASTYHKLFIVTDGGMNIAPTLEQKVSILKNSVIAAEAIGLEKINVAVLAAKEKEDPKMPCTIDATALKEMGEKGEFGTHVIAEGPLALDLAISKEAAKVKKVNSPVAGEADILLVPTIESGNMLAKSLNYFANAKTAGVIMGAKVPIVLVSRADTHETKLNSIAFGSVIAANKK